mgnify:CR=1 FL=1
MSLLFDEDSSFLFLIMLLMFEGASLDVVRNRFEVVRDNVLFFFDFVFNSCEELFNGFDEFSLLVELFRVACT